MSKRRYAVHKVVIGANQSEKITIRGNVVACIEAPTAFLLGFGDDTPSLFYQGFSVKADEGETFNYIRVENDTNAPIEITLAVGFGDIRDGRLNFSGTIQANIVNFPDERSLYDLPGVLREGANRVHVPTGQNTLVVPAANNVNGVIIRTANLMCWADSFCGISSTSGLNYMDFVIINLATPMFLTRPIEIAAGLDVYGYCQNSARLTFTYDIL